MILMLSLFAYAGTDHQHTLRRLPAQNLLYLPKIIECHGQIWGLPKSKISAGW
jgi:hypothetical protein